MRRGLSSGICLNTQPIKQTISELLALSPCPLTQRRGNSLLSTRRKRLLDLHFSHRTVPDVCSEPTHREDCLKSCTHKVRDHSDSQSYDSRHGGASIVVGCDGGGCLVRKQAHVFVLASVPETSSHSFTRCSRGAVESLFTDVSSARWGFTHWRFTRIIETQRVWGIVQKKCRHCRHMLDDSCATLSSNSTISAVKHLSWIHSWWKHRWLDWLLHESGCYWIWNHLLQCRH